MVKEFPSEVFILIHFKIRSSETEIYKHLILNSFIEGYFGGIAYFKAMITLYQSTMNVNDKESLAEKNLQSSVGKGKNLQRSTGRADRVIVELLLLLSLKVNAVHLVNEFV